MDGTGGPSLAPPSGGLCLSGWGGGALGLAIAEVPPPSACRDEALARRSLRGQPGAGVS